MTWLGHLLILLCLGTNVQASGTFPWSYSGLQGPESWHLSYPVCANTSESFQSPINIMTSFVRKARYRPLMLQSYDSTEGVEFEMINNGYSVIIKISGTALLSKGGLCGIYNATQIHFHWGSDKSQGSEHSINGKFFPLEIHIVHYNIHYPDQYKALPFDDGLAVLGIFVTISKKPNKNLSKFFDALENIVVPGSKVKLNETPLSSFLPEDRINFYRYAGSLTTPGCFETVTWTVFKDTVKISQEQMNKLRRLLSADNTTLLTNNYRPIQHLNGRLVTSN